MSTLRPVHESMQRDLEVAWMYWITYTNPVPPGIVRDELYHTFAAGYTAALQIENQITDGEKKA